MSCCAFFNAATFPLLDIVSVSLQKILCLFLENAYFKIQYAFRSIVVISLSTNCLVTRSCGTWYSGLPFLFDCFNSLSTYSFKTCKLWWTLGYTQWFIDWRYIISLKLLDNWRISWQISCHLTVTTKLLVLPQSPHVCWWWPPVWSLATNCPVIKHCNI